MRFSSQIIIIKTYVQLLCFLHGLARLFAQHSLQLPVLAVAGSLDLSREFLAVRLHEFSGCKVLSWQPSGAGHRFQWRMGLRNCAVKNSVLLVSGYFCSGGQITMAQESMMFRPLVLLVVSALGLHPLLQVEIPEYRKENLRFYVFTSSLESQTWPKQRILPLLAVRSLEPRGFDLNVGIQPAFQMLPHHHTLMPCT